MDNVILNKTASMERCLLRIEEEYHGFEPKLETNYSRQDAIILNLLRACEQAIDLANHLVKIKKLGIPKNTKDSFELLQEHQILSNETANILKNMVGFRNIATHEYEKLKLDILKNILTHHLQDFRTFAQIALSYAA
jgi:uncharacterized protein YutE (UPF0331/DUF86 family)